MRNYLKIALIAILIVNISGCAELRKKFIRKKEAKREEYSFYREEDYRPKPPHERYQDHYVLWHNWHLELERTDGTSFKRDIMAINEALRHLTAMKDLLVKEKAEELQEQIGQMETILQRLNQMKKDIVEDTHSRKLLGKVGRVVVNNFSYNRMQEYIVTSEE